MTSEQTGTTRTPGIEAAEVAHLSRLARLGLSPEELERMGHQLQDIIAAVSQLAEADIADVDATAQVGDLHNVTRTDEIEPSLAPEDALANARTKEAGLLRVPAIQ